MNNHYKLGQLEGMLGALFIYRKSGNQAEVDRVLDKIQELVKPYDEAGGQAGWTLDQAHAERERPLKHPGRKCSQEICDRDVNYHTCNEGERR